MAHLKRQEMPKFWPLQRKKIRFAPVPVPGPHPKNNCFPLLVVVRNIFKLCETRKEAKKIIKNKEILVDGREITEERFPVGLMDILTIKRKNKNFLILPSKKGFEFKEIGDEEAGYKYCKIIGKRMLKKGMQLNLHDGRNILLPKEEKDKYKVCDTIKISLKNKKILDVIPYKEGARVLVVRGRNRGKTGKIKEIIIRKDLDGQRVKVEIDKEDKLFKRDLIFTIPENFI